MPIYYGNDWIYETFERGSFVDYNDFASPESLAKFIKEMTDEEWLARMKKCIDVYNRSVDVTKKSDILAQTTEQIKKLLIGTHRIKKNLHFLTYEDERFKESRERVRKEALESGFFKQVFAFEPSNTQPLLSDEVRCFIQKNPRGGGYWIWRSYVIREVLSRIPKGDILIYLDSGSSINFKGGLKLAEYVEVLTSQKKNILAFQIPHAEKCYSKMDLLKFLNVSEADQNSGQLQAGLEYLVNNDETVNFFTRISSISAERGFSLIDDSESQEPNDSCFKDHRHDQSIFSALCKQAASCMFLPDMGWPLESGWQRGEPFLHTRLRNR